MSTIDLTGTWDCGPPGGELRPVTVPGLAADPRRPTAGGLCYRRELKLPGGDWRGGLLLLDGARFRPRVLLDGDEVARTEGGMGRLRLPLAHPHLRPGERVTLEIILAGHEDVPMADASRIPPADHWRSNLASCLWDDVGLRLHGGAWFTRVVPHTDFAAGTLTPCWRLGGAVPPDATVSAELRSGDTILALAEAPAAAGSCRLDPAGSCRPWRPEDPACYELVLRLHRGGRDLDRHAQTWGLRDFCADGTGFRLDGEPIHLRAGSVVWHRWLRDPEGAELAWDVDWFQTNVVERLRAHGANTLRFHLGMPPRRLIDLCDRNGLLVQAEWSFFHGLDAAPDSLRRQWSAWCEDCLHHPSVMLLHPWNETGAELLERAFGVLEEITPDFPPLVIAHRDVCHVHKYWWSLFENVGCYYDEVESFGQPIMVDEFGGTYLDGAGDPGAYPTLAEALLRFLGPGHTRAERLELQALANARIAEYWRRLDAAGFSPFCILGSPEDGNHHFIGPLRAGRPKPVWDALTAAYAPVSLSLEVWDRNHAPGQSVAWPLHLFNDTAEQLELTCVWRCRSTETVTVQGELTRSVPAHGHLVETAAFALPDEPGPVTLEAELRDPPAVAHPVVSAWPGQVVACETPPGLRGTRVGLSDPNGELAVLCRAQGLVPVDPDPGADLVVLERRDWPAVVSGALRADLETVSDAGRPVVCLDAGPLDLGQGYLADGDLGPLQEVRRVAAPTTASHEVLHGIVLHFRELGEPESCLHPTVEGAGLLHRLDKRSLQLWNGLRGGLIVPARELTVTGLDRAAFLTQWRARGADPERIVAGTQWAWELAGQYAFAAPEDPDAEAELRRRVRFLVEDAPALAGSIDPDGPVTVHDLGNAHAAATGRAATLQALARCGRGLTQTPVLRIDLVGGRGPVLVSQAITAGRLVPGHTHPEIVERNPLYRLRHDPAAAQFTLELLALALGKDGRP